MFCPQATTVGPKRGPKKGRRFALPPFLHIVSAQQLYLGANNKPLANNEMGELDQDANDESGFLENNKNLIEMIFTIIGSSSGLLALIIIKKEQI